MVPVKRLSLRTVCFLFVFSTLIGCSIPSYASQNAYYDFGVFAYEEGNFSKAKTFFKKALVKEPDNPICNHYMGKVFLKQKKYKEAKKYLLNAQKKEPDHAGIAYDIALTDFHTNDYTSAGSLFEDVVDQEPENTLARYYLAMCMFKEGNYSDAAVHFDQASEESSDLKQNCYYYSGICHLKTGRPKDAVNNFEYVIRHTNSNEVKTKAEKWLHSAQKLEKGYKPYSLYLKLGTRYDDNVQLEPLDLDVYSDESDFASVAFLSGTYNFFKGNRLGMSVGYDHYQTYYLDISGYDLAACSPNFSATYRINSMSEGRFTYTPTFYWVDYGNYMVQHYFKPEISLKIMPNLSGKFSLDYFGNNNYQIQGRSGQASGVSTDFVYLLQKQDLSITAGLSYLNNSPVESEFDYSDIEGRLGTFFTIPWDIQMSVYGKYRLRDFSSTTSSLDDSKKREDTKYKFAASFSRWFVNDKIALIFEYAFSQNDSNISSYEYRKNAVTLSAATKF
jgi:tetratricopeptide (TPR) repeat protein